MNLGRNEKCHCGSGKKYKKCHLDFDYMKMGQAPIPIEALEHFQKTLQEKEMLKELGIRVNYVRPLVHMGKKYWAIKNRLLGSPDIKQTFHEFIIDQLKSALGEVWWREQLGLPVEQQHFIMRCYFAFDDFKLKNAIPANRSPEDLWSGTPNGYTRSLLSLAFDVMSLQHTHDLPDHILTRLRNRDQYQGVRYEIAIAAIFARLGCNITFLDTIENVTTKHCEFIAIHEETNTSIAVEAKSRHRKGILHMEGSTTEKELMKGDVEHLFNRALLQNPGDRPFMVFIDMNTPAIDRANFIQSRWFEDVKKIMEKKNTASSENPQAFNAAFFTNYSYHYQTDKEADPGEHISIVSNYPKHPLPGDEFLEMLEAALSHYGVVPNLDTEERPRF